MIFKTSWKRLRGLIVPAVVGLLLTACSKSSQSHTCGQGVACDPGTTCNLGYLEWGWACSCSSGKMDCQPQAGGGGAGPSGPPEAPVDCAEAYCAEDEYAERCTYKEPDCTFEVACDINSREATVSGGCP
jgi:hypothetical protein